MDAPEERLGVKTGGVRFCLKSRHRRCVPARPLRAITGSEQVQQDTPEKARPAYSITSSARASSVGGMSRPSAFAVLRLITSSNLVG
jgi:hypothetical protein